MFYMENVSVDMQRWFPFSHKTSFLNQIKPTHVTSAPNMVVADQNTTAGLKIYGFLWASILSVQVPREFEYTVISRQNIFTKKHLSKRIN